MVPKVARTKIWQNLSLTRVFCNFFSSMDDGQVDKISRITKLTMPGKPSKCYLSEISYSVPLIKTGHSQTLYFHKWPWIHSGLPNWNNGFTVIRDLIVQYISYRHENFTWKVNSFLIYWATCITLYTIPVVKLFFIATIYSYTTMLLIYPTPPLRQHMTQGQFLSQV